MELPLIHISDKPLELEKITQLVTDDACGAIDIFVGTVRDQTQGKKVLQLDLNGSNQSSNPSSWTSMPPISH